MIQYAINHDRIGNGDWMWHQKYPKQGACGLIVKYEILIGLEMTLQRQDVSIESKLSFSL